MIWYHECPFSLKMSRVLYKWLPSRGDHIENIYVPGSRRGIKPSTSSLFSAIITNLLTGHSRHLDFWLVLSTDPINSVTLRATHLSFL